MFWYNLLQIVAIFILFDEFNASSIDTWKEKVIFCLLVIFPIITIIIYIGYLIYNLFKKGKKGKK